jgi:hypothetical protein
MRKKKWMVGVLIPLVVAGVGTAVATAPAASAAEQGLGTCAGRVFDFRRSAVTLDAGNTLGGRILLALTIEKTSRVGDAWRVRITQNDAVIIAKDAVTTFLPSPFFLFGGSAVLNVREVVPNLPGVVDRFGAVATNLRTGETCTAQAQEVVEPPDPL